MPTSGGITQARQRLGYEPVKELFSEVAAPVAEGETAGAFLGSWRLMAIDGFEWDAPDTPENAAAFGFAGTGAEDADRPAFPKVRVVTVSGCASHVVAEVAMGAVAGKGAGEQSLARTLYPRLDDSWLLIADRNFFNWADWCTAADTGAALLWRVKADLTLPVRFQATPPACYRASWQLPGPDFHRQATTSLRTRRNTMALRHGVTSCSAGRTRSPQWRSPRVRPAGSA